MKYLKLFETFINIGELDITQEELNYYAQYLTDMIVDYKDYQNDTSFEFGANI
jgi:hypothetical protein